MINFDKIVNKLLKKWWKILWKKDIFEIVDPECKPEFQKKVDMIIYRLKAEWIIIPLKSWVYLIPRQLDFWMNEVDLMEKYFLQLLKKYITYHVWNQYLLWGVKALEIHMKNYSIPEKIIVITRKLEKKIQVWNYEIIFKTVSWKYQWKKVNMFSKLYENTTKKTVEEVELKITSIEHALLETALMQENYAGVSIEILTKAIKKYGSVFNNKIFEDLWKYKYIMSFNRLKEISKPIDKELSQLCLNIIKKNWWLFIGEGLRGF